MGLPTGYGEGYIRPPMSNSIKLPTKTEIREADQGGQGHFRLRPDTSAGAFARVCRFHEASQLIRPPSQRKPPIAIGFRNHGSAF